MTRVREVMTNLGFEIELKIVGESYTAVIHAPLFNPRVCTMKNSWNIQHTREEVLADVEEYIEKRYLRGIL